MLHLELPLSEELAQPMIEILWWEMKSNALHHLFQPKGKEREQSKRKNCINKQPSHQTHVEKKIDDAFAELSG